MLATFYLVVQGKRTRLSHSPIATGTIRVAKRKPPVKADEIAVRIQMEIPDAFFLKPTLQASLSLPAGKPMGAVIDCQVRDNIAQAIEKISGLQVHLTVGD